MVAHGCVVVGLSLFGIKKKITHKKKNGEAGRKSGKKLKNGEREERGSKKYIFRSLWSMNILQAMGLGGWRAGK